MPAECTTTMFGCRSAASARAPARKLFEVRVLLVRRGAQHEFDRHRPLQNLVPPLIDHAHPTPADLLQQPHRPQLARHADVDLRLDRLPLPGDAHRFGRRGRPQRRLPVRRRRSGEGLRRIVAHNYRTGER